MLSAHKKNILVVEDERSLLAAIKVKLEKSGFGVSTAQSINQAREQLSKNNIDGIWLDHYLLGRETGIDLVVECKSENSPYKNMPIFIVSNTASHDKVMAYLELGVSKYYVKAEKRLDEIISEVRAKIEKK